MSELNSSLESRTFQLTIWHPSALPSNMQNREGWQKLNDVFHQYPDNPSRRGREKAIKSVRAFVKEALRLLKKEGSESDYLGTALHIHFYLTPDDGIRMAGAIAESAERHGLACYCAEIDRLSLPPPLVSRKAAHSALAVPDEQGIELTVGPWALRVYVETTRSCYAKIKQGGSDRCRCHNCANFSQVRDQAYPPELLPILEPLGIDFRKESEVHYYGRLDTGLHTYRGWYYFVGSIQQGPDGGADRRYHQLGPSSKIGLGTKSKYGYAEWETVIIKAGFAKFPCVELDFYADLPWLSDAPEPLTSDPTSQ